MVHSGSRNANAGVVCLKRVFGNVIPCTPSSDAAPLWAALDTVDLFNARENGELASHVIEVSVPSVKSRSGCSRNISPVDMISPSSTIAQWLLCDESASLAVRLGLWQELYASEMEQAQQYLLPGKLTRGLCIEMIQTGHQHEYVKKVGAVRAITPNML
jgi:hypothetical protein